MKEFNRVKIDLQNGIFELDGEDISKKSITNFRLEYNDGHWTVDYKTKLISKSKNKKITYGK